MGVCRRTPAPAPAKPFAHNPTSKQASRDLSHAAHLARACKTPRAGTVTGRPTKTTRLRNTTVARAEAPSRPHAEQTDPLAPHSRRATVQTRKALAPNSNNSRASTEFGAGGAHTPRPTYCVLAFEYPSPAANTRAIVQHACNTWLGTRTSSAVDPAVAHTLARTLRHVPSSKLRGRSEQASGRRRSALAFVKLVRAPRRGTSEVSSAA